MKKIGMLAIAALAMISCGNTYTAKQVKLQDQTDSVNYALGLMNGAMIRMQQMQNDSSDAVITEFIDALDRAYNGKSEKLTDVQEMARNVAFATKEFEKKGLAENQALILNEKIFFQAFVNAVNEDTTIMTTETASNYFRQIYMSTMGQDAAEGKAILAKCPTKVGSVDLKNMQDSANYAMGYLNGSEIKMYVLAEDSTGDDLKMFIKTLNKALKQKFNNPQLMGLGENIGNVIREQETSGLIDIPGMETRFELIKQGFINGMKGMEEGLSMMEAQTYVQQVVNELKFGEMRRQGEQFLIENALRENVKVTDSGLQYEVLTMGHGKKPSATDQVRVHYEGSLVDGTVFDSSYQRGEPTVFGVNQVIAGWQEGLQLMPVGSTFMFYIPQNLGYGERGAGNSIPPYATLIFKVELLGIE